MRHPDHRRPRRHPFAAGGVLAIFAAVLLAALAPQGRAWASPRPELRGTWLTTTANDAIAAPDKTARTMARLRDIGINTVYVECWKNGYTQFPSATLNRVIGLDRRPALMPQDPSDRADDAAAQPRDLLAESLIEAHRNGLVYIAWFEYGFMAAHKSTDTHLRRMKPEWLSRNIRGETVAPNGFVWMNPLHPECRRFLTDLVLEAIDRYDLDGVQLDDRIVWPHVTMGYDDFTRGVYAAEHQGRQPPDDHLDPAWMRWRADKVNEYARQFVTEIRARRPGLVISLSPAVYPWCYDNYCLEWPKWADFDAGWDEFIPQNYRFSYPAFEKTWLEQIGHWRRHAGSRGLTDLMPGIRLVGEGEDSTWEQLRDSIELSRREGSGGHVLWFSRGVLDVFAEPLRRFYRQSDDGRSSAVNPHFPLGWRPGSIVLERKDGRWTVPADVSGRYRVIARTDGRWAYVGEARQFPVLTEAGAAGLPGIPDSADAVELLVDRTADMSQPRAAKRVGGSPR